MELIQNLFQYFANGSVEEQFASVTGDKKLLFITPTVTGENFYRIILPFSYLTQYAPTIQTAMTGIVSHNPTQPYEQRVTQGIKENHIKWANIIIFPFTSQALKPLYEEIRDINPAAKILFNFDANVFRLSDSHPMKSFFTEEKLSDVDDNILLADLTLFPNDEAKKYFVEEHFSDTKYIDRLGGRNPGVFATFPYLAQYAAMYEDKKPPQSPKGKMRLAVPVNDTLYDELKLFAPYLQEVSDKLTTVAEIVVIGGRKSDAAFADAMKGIRHIHIPAHPEVEMQYEEILKSGADIFLYLSKDSFYNKTSDDPKRIIDYGIVGIPCIIPACSPMAEIVKTTGWVMEDNALLAAIVEQAACHRPTHDQHAVATFNSIVKNFSYGNPAAVSLMKDIFEQ